MQDAEGKRHQLPMQLHRLPSQKSEGEQHSDHGLGQMTNTLLGLFLKYHIEAMYSEVVRIRE